MCLEGPQVEISIERVLAPGSGRDGAARVGACVAGAAHLSRALADHGEDAGLLEIGTDLFEEQCSALDDFATQW